MFSGGEKNNHANRFLSYRQVYNNTLAENIPFFSYIIITPGIGKGSAKFPNLFFIGIKSGRGVSKGS
jgi:hypothetical protein